MNDCQWSFDDNEDAWFSSCDDGFVFTEGGPVDNRFSYCPYCGKELVENNADSAEVMKDGGQ